MTDIESAAAEALDSETQPSEPQSSEPQPSEDQLSGSAFSESEAMEPHPSEPRPSTSHPLRPAPLAPTPKAFSHIVGGHFESLLANQRAVLESGDVEGVHKFRVTTRRLQAALDLLQFDKDPLRIRSMKKQLRRCRRSLSRVRNYDVFLMLIESEAASTRQIDSASLEKLNAAFKSRRDLRYSQARKPFERADFVDLASRLGVAPGSEGGDAVPGVLDGDETAIEMRARAAARLEQRLGELQLMAAQSYATTDPQKVHQLRIAAKRMRYLVETVSEMGHGDADQALSWLKTLQERLGDWHDLAALEDEIINVVGRRKFIRKHLNESGSMIQLAARLRKKRASLDSKLFPVRLPRYMATTTRRMVRALRESSSQHDPAGSVSD